jgi:SpoVK/Ycf46/Vps4 family AAA+-type ATPase
MGRQPGVAAKCEPWQRLVRCLEAVMAGSEIIQELVRSHIDGDDERFRTIALQLAAVEARHGHRLVASRIRDLLDRERSSDYAQPIPLTRTSPDLIGVLETSYPTASMHDIVLGADASERLKRVLQEQRSRDVLHQWSLIPSRKLLFHGPSGCGKTLAAEVIAGELKLPLIRIRLEVLFSRYLGQTGAQLAAIFAEMDRVRGLFLFDEFDGIGRQRSDSQDVGEAKRVVTTFLQLLDSDRSHSLIVAATNEVDQLDAALFRRFDDTILFPPPTESQLLQLLRLRAGSAGLSSAQLARITRVAVGMSFADVSKAATDALKTTVLAGRKRVTGDDLRLAIAKVRPIDRPSR